jgi:hypothetical protein
MKHYVGVQLRARLTVLDRALLVARKTPSEDALHDLRVAARRYSQALRLFAEFLDPKRVKQMRSRLRRLMDHAGAVRNLDVTQRVLESAGVRDVQLTETLMAERAELQSRLLKHLTRWRGNRSVKRWRKWLRPTEPTGKTWNREAPAAQNAHRVLPRLLDELFAAGARAIARGTERELHRFRLLGKRFRYSLELFADAYGANTETCLRRLRVLQDHLGSINDCVTALGLVQGSGHAEEAVTKLLQRRRQEFIEYWSLFQNQQDRWRGWVGGRDGALRSAPR